MLSRIIFFSLLSIIFLGACDGMYDSLDEYSEEVVYPAKYDTIVGHIGYERVEFDLMKAGRIPSDEINRSEEHTSELQSLMRISFPVFCLNNIPYTIASTIHNNPPTTTQ